MLGPSFWLDEADGPVGRVPELGLAVDGVGFEAGDVGLVVEGVGFELDALGCAGVGRGLGGELVELDGDASRLVLGGGFGLVALVCLVVAGVFFDAVGRWAVVPCDRLSPDVDAASAEELPSSATSRTRERKRGMKSSLDRESDAGPDNVFDFSYSPRIGRSANTGPTHQQQIKDRTGAK